MSVTTTATIQADLNWAQIDRQPLTHIADIGSVSTDNALSNGSGNEECNMLWHDIFTLGSGQSKYINLQSLIRTVFSQDVTVGFEKVRCIAIKNQSENIGAYITVTASGSNGFTSIFSGSTGKAPVHPKCSIIFPNVIEGWTVSGASKQIEINDAGGSGCTFEIAVIGVSGSG